MNISFLPEKVKDEFAGLMEKASFTAARTSGNISGDPGEGYLVACGEKLFIYSRNAGEDTFLKLAGKLGEEISRLEIRKDKFNPFLDVDLGGRSYSLKFSSAELRDLETLVENFKKARPEAAVAAEQAPAAPQPAHGSGTGIQMPSGIQPEVKPAPGKLPLPPMQYMAAAMMYVAASDGNIDKDEDRYIMTLFCGNNDILQPALQYYKSHTAEQLFENAGALDDGQKLCILANLVELAMHDDSYHRVEQMLIRNFMEKAGISMDNLKAITNVLLVKNNLSVLG